jgi:hypothetical protein
MRNWQAFGGAAVWMLVATLMASAALRPVDVAAALVHGEIGLVSLCANAGGNPALGCESVHL